MQTASIDTDVEKRDNHLRSADFFDAEKFPTLTFRSKRVQAAGENRLDVVGDLTLHGVTHEVQIPVTVLGILPGKNGDKAGFSTHFTIDRKDYGITWNRALDQGGTLLGDDVEVSIQIEANGEPPAKTS